MTDGRQLRTIPAPARVTVFDATWEPLGTIHPVDYSDPAWLGTNPDAPWVLPTYSEWTTAVTFTDANPDLIRLVLSTPIVWLWRPRMKRRAARRIAGYTRTGQRRR